jgi:hypothetical protein
MNEENKIAWMNRNSIEAIQHTLTTVQEMLNFPSSDPATRTSDIIQQLWTLKIKLMETINNKAQH